MWHFWVGAGTPVSASLQEQPGVGETEESRAVVWGGLLAETIGILLLLFLKGHWKRKFSNVFCNPEHKERKHLCEIPGMGSF